MCQLRRDQIRHGIWKHQYSLSIQVLASKIPCCNHLMKIRQVQGKILLGSLLVLVRQIESSRAAFRAQLIDLIENKSLSHSTSNAKVLKRTTERSLESSRDLRVTGSKINEKHSWTNAWAHVTVKNAVIRWRLFNGIHKEQPSLINLETWDYTNWASNWRKSSQKSYSKTLNRRR